MNTYSSWTPGMQCRQRLLLVPAVVAIFAGTALLARGVGAEDACCPDGHEKGKAAAHQHAPTPAGAKATAAGADLQLAGVVTNGTTRRPLAGATVQVVRPAVGKAKADKIVQKIQTDARGRFRLRLPRGTQEHLLVTRVVWQNFPYETIAYVNTKHASALQFKQQPSNIQLAVYDTTRTDPGLRFKAHHIGVESKAGGLQCTERILVENPSQKTFVGQDHQHLTLGFNLPAAAREVKLNSQLEEAKLVKESGNYRVSKIIPPQAYQSEAMVEVSYFMPWSGLPWARRIELSRRVAYPTSFFFLTRAESEAPLKIEGAGLSADEMTPLSMGETTETRIVNTYGKPHGKDVLKAGTLVPISIYRPINPLFWGFLGVILSFCALVPVVLRQSSARNNSPVLMEQAVAGPTPAPAAGSQAVRLAQQIADLDARAEAGQLPAGEYEKQRAQWKEELVRIMQTG